MQPQRRDDDKSASVLGKARYPFEFGDKDRDRRIPPQRWTYYKW